MADNHNHSLGPAATGPGGTPDPRAGLISYVIVNAETHELVRQGYCPEAVLYLQASPGMLAVKTNGVVDFSRCKYENGAIVPLPETPNALRDTIEVPDSLTLVMDAAPGSAVTLADGTSFSETNGKLTVTFKSSGDQVVRVTTPGYKAVSAKVKVVPLTEKKKRLKLDADAERDATLLNTVTVDGNPYRADDAMQLTALTLGFKALAVRGTPEEATFSAKVITADNKVATLNAAQTLRLVNRIAKEREDVFIAARQRKGDIEKGTVPGGVVSTRT